MKIVTSFSYFIGDIVVVNTFICSLYVVRALSTAYKYS